MRGNWSSNQHLWPDLRLKMPKEHLKLTSGSTALSGWQNLGPYLLISHLWFFHYVTLLQMVLTPLFYREASMNLYVCPGYVSRVFVLSTWWSIHRGCSEPLTDPTDQAHIVTVLDSSWQCASHHLPFKVHASSSHSIRPESWATCILVILSIAALLLKRVRQQCLSWFPVEHVPYHSVVTCKARTLLFLLKIYSLVSKL